MSQSMDSIKHCTSGVFEVAGGHVLLVNCPYHFQCYQAIRAYALIYRTKVKRYWEIINIEAATVETEDFELRSMHT